MTWRRIWFWFLLITFLSFLGFELSSILADHGYVAFTLSDTIRDWEIEHSWIKWVVAIAFAGLWAHFFIFKNEPPSSG
jgi:hypothetical protein